jgi:hypothetical protein
MLDVIERKYLKQLPHILGALTLLVVASALAAALFWIRASRPTTEPINTTAVVVVFEGADCQGCDAFRRQIGRPYQGSPTGELAPLRYYDLTGGPPPRRYGLRSDIGSTPTTVIFDVFGREAARWAGMPGTVEAFEAFVKPHLRRAQRDLEHAAGARHIR